MLSADIRELAQCALVSGLLASALLIFSFHVAQGRVLALFSAITLFVVYIALDIWLGGFAGFWPPNPSQRLSICALGAVSVIAVEISGNWVFCGLGQFVGTAFKAVACFGSVGLIVRAVSQDDGGGLAKWYGVLAIIAVWLFVQWTLLDRLAGVKAAQLAITLAVVALISGGAFERSGSVDLAKTEIALGGCLVAASITARLWNAQCLVRGMMGGVTLIHSCLVTFGYWYGQLPALVAILLVAWPMFAWLTIQTTMICRRQFTLPTTLLGILAPALVLGVLMEKQLIKGTFSASPIDRSNGNNFVFVSLEGDRCIAVFRSETGTGRLGRVGRTETEGIPRFLAIDPGRRLLVASIANPDSLASYRIDPVTGHLTHVNSIAYPAQAYLSTDIGCRYLLCANYDLGHISVFSLSSDGMINDQPRQVITTAPRAHALQFDSESHFAYAPHTSPNTIFQFSFDRNTGNLCPAATPKIMTPPRTGPRNMVFHPRKDTAYVINEFGSSVTAYHKDRNTGLLSQFQTISTVPEAYVGRNACSEIHIHHSGSFLYAANRFHDSIACFRIDATSDQLSLIEIVKTERMPWSFDLNADGEFLYVAGRDWGRVATYRIHQDTGRLTRVRTDNIGRQPVRLISAFVN